MLSYVGLYCTCVKILQHQFCKVSIHFFIFFPNRILLCAHCGDHYPVELILGPLFSNQSCSKYPNRNDSVMLETFVGSEKKKVLITFTSYHRKQQYLVVTCCVQIQIEIEKGRCMIDMENKV